MKHKNLVESFNFATNKTDKAKDPTVSGSEVVRLSEQQKSLNRITEYNIKKKQQLAKLHERLKIPVEPSKEDVPGKYNPSRFDFDLNRLKLYYGEFQKRFRDIDERFKYTREDYKRTWLFAVGATIEEMVTLTGRSIDNIRDWQNRSAKKDQASLDAMSKWIIERATKGISLSGTASPSQLGIDVTKEERLEELNRLNKLHAMEKRNE